MSKHIQPGLLTIAVVAIGFFAGCSSVKHMDQLLTLKGLADEQVAMNEYVAAQDKKFDQMVAEQQAGTLNAYQSKSKIVRTFGEPIFKKHVTFAEGEREVWLYRYAVEFFKTDKLYLYFDGENLVDTEYVKESNEQIGQKTEEKNGHQAGGVSR